MRLWKKIAIFLLAIILLAQIPFIYNRYEFGRLAEKINALQTQRIEKENPNFNDFKGIIHAHTNLGGHSTGSFDELIQGANANNLDFVVMTEHTSELYDTSALTLNGVYGQVLFVGGNEVETLTDRFLLLPGAPDAHRGNKMTTPDFLQKAHAENRLAIVAYPEKHKTWDAGFDGIEVFSLNTNAKKMNPPSAFFDALWSYRAYGQLVLAKYFRRPDDNLRRFDELTKTRKLIATAGTDAHSNIGFHLLGDDAQNKLINIKLDDYETIFHLMRNHVLIEKDKTLTRENLLEALKNGHGFIAFDVLANAKGFSFTAENGAETKTMGDEIALAADLNLKAAAPLPSRFVIFKDGEKVFENTATEINFHVSEKGTYRTEVYLDSLGNPFDKMPWIISNPIYVK